jgi:ribosomal protein L31
MAGPDEFEKFPDGVAMNASHTIGIGITTAATLLAPATVEIASAAHPSAHTGQQQIAADLGIAEGTVTSRLHYAGSVDRGGFSDG